MFSQGAVTPKAVQTSASVLPTLPESRHMAPMICAVATMHNVVLARMPRRELNCEARSFHGEPFRGSAAMFAFSRQRISLHSFARPRRRHKGGPQVVRMEIVAVGPSAWSETERVRCHESVKQPPISTLIRQLPAIRLIGTGPERAS